MKPSTHETLTDPARDLPYATLSRLYWGPLTEWIVYETIDSFFGKRFHDDSAGLLPIRV